MVQRDCPVLLSYSWMYYNDVHHRRLQSAKSLNQMHQNHVAPSSLAFRPCFRYSKIWSCLFLTKLAGTPEEWERKWCESAGKASDAQRGTPKFRTTKQDFPCTKMCLFLHRVQSAFCNQIVRCATGVELELQLPRHKNYIMSVFYTAHTGVCVHK